eukprot:comp21797_c0_seq1/m.30995 comp21797_c0_seq1/g.30995  ORF comp21797_c0_seq1/g.30995 comp21797_c0_seq1/m.30995 type:complete len:797 (-) comp21797_c0_seq1:477-2867(-)
MAIKRYNDDDGSYAPKRSRNEAEYNDYDDGEDDYDGGEIVIPKAAGARLEADMSTLSANDRLSSRFRSDVDGKVHDYAKLVLKPDHQFRPLYVAPDGRIFLESFSPIYQRAYDFLIAIAEPVCRPRVIHEYNLTAYSLYAAVSVGLQTDDIISVLERLSKTPLPNGIIQYIRLCTTSYGKAKLVLKQNHYFIESAFPQNLQMLLKDNTIRNARVAGQEMQTSDAPKGKDLQVAGLRPKQPGTDQDAPDMADLPEDLCRSLVEKDDEDDEEDVATAKVHSFEINKELVEDVKRTCLMVDMPLLEEYDFRNDTYNVNLDIDLKPSTVLRPYQEKSLAKMFGNGRARSGIIVLPCGAGKTLTGVSIACTIKKSTLVLCTSGVSVDQWAEQFKMWSTVRHDNVVQFMANRKDDFKDTSVTVSTYNMIAHQRQRAPEAQKLMQKISGMEWGLLILDEVHVVPANMFRKVLTSVQAHCKVGLTATLVREDDKITDLNFLIGPKLYEANWMDLQNAGYLAKVRCNEVWCSMTPEFYSKYLDTSGKQRSLLWVMNPNKFRTCQFLCRMHERRGDKIIVFSDNVFCLRQYATKLKCPYIDGDTGHPERTKILSSFVKNPMLNIIFLSKVGDTSIDLPDANVLIQISSHYGSRRQEAQRLGRILRAKKGRPKPKEGEFNAFFYSLVSKDTQEMYYSAKRQQFLVEQGYTFDVITDVMSGEDTSQLLLGAESEQRDWLTMTIEAMERSASDAKLLAEDFDPDADLGRRGNVTRTKGNMSAVSGGSGISYIEYKAPRNKLFKDRYRKN